MHWREVIRRPVVTEKSNILASEENEKPSCYNLGEEAIELAWPEVTVEKVRVANMPAKRARRWRRMTTRKTGWKKAIVTLARGSSIDLFEGVS